MHDREEQETQLHKNESPCSSKKIISPRTKTLETIHTKVSIQNLLILPVSLWKKRFLIEKN
jgi:hypothetical protein